MAKSVGAFNYLVTTFKSFVIITSLTAVICGCQTTETDKTTAKTKEILDSQKAIVHNALDNGDAKLAHQTLRKLINDFPNDASLQNLMGLTQLSMKNAARAVKHFQIAYKLDKKPGSALNLSSALIEMGDYEKAVSTIKNAMEQKGEPYEFKERFLHNLAYAHLKQKKNVKAEGYFKAAIEENPSFYPSHLELARLHKQLGRPALAMRSYREAMDYCQICLDPVSELTTLYVKAGKMGEARDILIKYNKVQGVGEIDRKKANGLLNIVTAAGNNPNKKL